MVTLLGLERGGGGGGHGGGGHGGGGHGGGHGHGHGGRGRGGGPGWWDYGPGVVVAPTCPQVYAPVIGADGLTYDNACYATMAGVSVVQALSGLGGPAPDCVAACNATSFDPATCIAACPPADTSPSSGAAVFALVYQGLMLVSTALSAYHGYKRNNGSVGWAIGWGLLGGLFPVITPAIAFAEGFGKPKKG